MEIELLEIRDFLAERLPFSELPDDALDELPRRTLIRYLRRGTDFPPQTEIPYLYILRSGAIEIRDDQGQLVEKLGEGDLFGTSCLPQPDTHTGHVSEDCLLYLLPCEHIDLLRAEHQAVEQFFNATTQERLRTGLDGDVSSLTRSVADLLNRPTISTSGDTTIRQAARLMTEHQVSSLLILENNRLAGMLTDSDMRKRCIAEGIDTASPVRQIMTAELHTLPSNTLLSEALLAMTRLQVHHLPVVDGDSVKGLITVSDLIRLQSHNPVFLTSAIQKAGSLDELINISRQVPELQVQLSGSSATAQHIGEAISTITDAITQKLIEMAIQQLGTPPVAFVWLAGGSQARLEQSSHSDQDNALLIADDLQPGQEAYFAELAQFVNDGLDACGYVYCPGEAMASNPKWRQPLARWKQTFNHWITSPEPMSLMLASIFFDLRPVYGETSLFDELQHNVLTMTRSNGIFIAYMAGNALAHRPPLGFFRNFVLVHDGEHDDTLDIKHRGIVPIVDIARVLALAEGIDAVNTRGRLQAATERGKLSREMSDNLQDALEFIASLRIQHQATQIRNGLPPDNYLPPTEISELERRQLKEAFAVIQLMQQTLESRYQGGRFR